MHEISYEKEFKITLIWNFILVVLSLSLLVINKNVKSIRYDLNNDKKVDSADLLILKKYLVDND